MTPPSFDLALRAALPLADEGHEDAAWRALAPLHDEPDPAAAVALVVALRHPRLDLARRLDHARALLERWPTDIGVLTALGEATESLCDRRYLNAAPPEDPFFDAVVSALADAGDAATENDDVCHVAFALATAARIAGRGWDAACEQAHRILIARRPTWKHWYNFGLFLKTRGRFAEALEANRAAAATGGADDESVIWNLGICATAVGDGATALPLWRGIGCRVELGDDGLPVGRWEYVQVRLAERPLAERGAADDDPGAEETVWVERLSPCHGRVLSPLYADLGVEYGDLVLFDGAAIVVRRIQDRDVPVFPHLTTLRREHWPVYRFGATQEEGGQVAALALPDGAQVYVHTEQVRQLCRGCWENVHQDDHDAHPRRVVTGKVVVPPGVPLAGVASALDAQLTDGKVLFYVPDLWAAVGDEGRAEVERRRFAMLMG